MGHQRTYRTAGRPRLVPYAGAASPRDQILDAAAQLFVGKGFAATSTREIADLVGIRQASLYYHFANKDEILVELLHKSVRPTVDKIAKIESLVPPETHETALYLLALVDVHTLATAPHNIGLLARLPDVTRCAEYSDFRSTQLELSDAYGRLGASIAKNSAADLLGPRRLGKMLFQVVDAGVIPLRVDGETIDSRAENAIATTCLSICGISDNRIIVARETALQLVSAFHDEDSTRA